MMAKEGVTDTSGPATRFPATDLRGRLRAQGFAWDDTEVIATVVDEWLFDSSDCTLDTVADIDGWQQ